MAASARFRLLFSLWLITQDWQLTDATAYVVVRRAADSPKAASLVIALHTAFAYASVTNDKAGTGQQTPNAGTSSCVVAVV